MFDDWSAEQKILEPVFKNWHKIFFVSDSAERKLKWQKFKTFDDDRSWMFNVSNCQTLTVAGLRMRKARPVFQGISDRVSPSSDLTIRLLQLKFNLENLGIFWIIIQLPTKVSDSQPSIALLENWKVCPSLLNSKDDDFLEIAFKTHPSFSEEEGPISLLASICLYF